MIMPHLHRAARRFIGVAVLALLLGQWTALVHSIGHEPRHDAQATEADHDHAHDAWGHQAGTAECQLVDHLLVGQAPGWDPAPLVWPLERAALPDAPAPAISPCSATRAYEARGPPRA